MGAAQLTRAAPDNALQLKAGVGSLAKHYGDYRESQGIYVSANSPARVQGVGLNHHDFCSGEEIAMV